VHARARVSTIVPSGFSVFQSKLAYKFYYCFFSFGRGGGGGGLVSLRGGGGGGAFLRPAGQGSHTWGGVTGKL